MGDVADLLMPKLGLTMTEGTVARWLVSPGDRFSAGDTIVIIETDKIANEVEAPASGEVTALLSSEGDVVPVGTPIAHWRLEGANTAARVNETAPQPVSVETRSSAPLRTAQPANPDRSTERIIATPYARRLARETAIDLAKVTGSGPRGRIKAADILRAEDAHAPGRQLAPTTPSMERATRSVAPAAPLSFASIDVDVSALRAIDARLAATRDRPFERLAYVALACTKALAGDSDGVVRIGFEANRTLNVIECTARDTLSAVTTRVAQNPASAGSGDVAIVTIEGRTRLVVPAIPTGWRMALGLGGVRAARGGDTTDEMTLAITYDSTTLDHTSASRILDHIAALLEEPLHLLAT